MLMIFGLKNDFAVEYIIKKNPFDEKGILNKTWGIFRLWIDGKNILQYKNNNSNEYEWNLIYIYDWFKKNIDSIMLEEEFPLKIKGETCLKKFENSLDFDSEDDEIFFKWFDIRQNWYFRHSLSSSCEGSFLAEVFFIKSKDSIEITWNNKNLYEDVIFFSENGFKQISIVKFKNIIMDYLNSFDKDVLLY